jgi:aryl-alcohol dehydrogenase-like predicted oxidoreductase
MEYRQLGKTSVNVSVISFGCMSLGQDQAVNDSLIRSAIDAGINLFDTADIYDKGQNERSVGRALRGIRDKVILCTKVGNVVKADGSGLDWNPSPAHILKSVEESLLRLQTDYIDLYQLHGGTIDDPRAEIIATFEKLQQQGKIRYYGISSIRPNVICEYVAQSHISSVMMQYSLLDRRPEEACLSLLKENDISVLVRGALAQGLLAGKPARDYTGYDKETVRQLQEIIKRYSSPERSAAQTALQFVLKNPAVTSAVTGIRTPEQLAELTKPVPQLTNEEYAAIKAAATPNRYTDHR